MLRSQLDTTGNLLKDLIAFWPLDEPGGQRRDILGYNPLTDNATVTSAKGIGGQGTAAKFTKANDEYLSISDNPYLSAGDIDITWTCWIYFDSLVAAEQHGIIIKNEGAPSSTNATNEYAIYRNPDNSDRLSLRIGDGTATNVYAHSTVTLTTGRWYFVAAWHDSVANNINIQIDNGLINSTSHTSGILNGVNKFAIGGGGGDGGTAFDGRIQYVGFWKRVLSQQERTDLYNFGRGNRLITY